MSRIPFIALLALLILGAPSSFTQADQLRVAQKSRLVGQLLVSAPEMNDPFFKRSVVYIVDHGANGALGVIINKVIGQGTLANLMRSFGLRSKGVQGTIDLHFGGPVKRNAGFILHSSEYDAAKSRVVGGGISFTGDVRILRARANGSGPKHLLFAIGYAGWNAGQLELEIARGDWTVKPATETVVFENSRSEMWADLSGASIREL